jgi:hypothetical protein
VSGRNWSVPYRLGQHRVHKPLIYLAGNQHSNKFLCSEKRIYQHHKEALKNAADVGYRINFVVQKPIEI